MISGDETPIAMRNLTGSDCSARIGSAGFPEENRGWIPMFGQ